jgi:hypothetical protein
MKKHPGIDYSFRPTSYWADTSPLSAILRNVKGENRRQMITDFWKAGRLEDLEPSILLDEQDDESRKRRGRIHPSFMGGEYLPGYRGGEVEIARIALESTTADVISLRARPAGQSIAYQVVDEYDSSFDLPFARSREPVSLARLIRLLDKGRLRDPGFPLGLSLGYNQLGVWYAGYAFKRHFTRITSEFYPQLFAHYERFYDDWVAAGEASQGTLAVDGGAA